MKTKLRRYTVVVPGVSKEDEKVIDAMFARNVENKKSKPFGVLEKMQQDIKKLQDEIETLKLEKRING